MSGLHDACLKLDLSRLVRRLVAEDGFQTTSDAAEAIEEYKLFLANAIASSPKRVFATPAVDKVWQRHFLDTKIYHDDCNSFLQLASKAKGYIHRLKSTDDEGLYYLHISADKSLAISSNSQIDIETKVSALAKEDLSYLVNRVQSALAQKVSEQSSPKAWIVDGLRLVNKEPKACLLEYSRFLELFLNRTQKGRLTPSKLVCISPHNCLIFNSTILYLFRK